MLKIFFEIPFYDQNNFNTKYQNNRISHVIILIPGGQHGGQHGTPNGGPLCAHDLAPHAPKPALQNLNSLKDMQNENQHGRRKYFM